MTEERDLVPREIIEKRIMLMRGWKVILDADLAALYGVETRKLNQAVQRNTKRFPEDFMFHLTPEEKREVITICDNLPKLEFAHQPPFAFTKYGAVMAATDNSVPLVQFLSFMSKNTPIGCSSNFSQTQFLCEVK